MARDAQAQVEEEFTFGDGGWVRYLATGLPVAVFVRFTDTGKRLVVADLSLADTTPTGLSAGTVRRVPVGRIEAFVNADPEAVRSHLRLTGPEVRSALTAGFGGTLGDPENLGSATITVPSGRVSVPTGRPYPPSFYEAVAAAYRGLVGRVHNPVGQMADDNGVPLTTVQRWVRVARDRGLLPKASHGKAG